MSSQSNEPWTSEYVRSEGDVQQIRKRLSKDEKDKNRKSIMYTYSPTQEAMFRCLLHVAEI